MSEGDVRQLLIDTQTQALVAIARFVDDPKSLTYAIDSVNAAFHNAAWISSRTFYKDRPPIDYRTRKMIHERDEFRCLKCGSSENLQIDHVIPVALGGDSSDENLQTLCQTCNREKSASVSDFR